MGSASSSSLRAAGLLDPNRAFQAINAETLETASAMADYTIPPVTTQVTLQLGLTIVVPGQRQQAGTDASAVLTMTAFFRDMAGLRCSSDVLNLSVLLGLSSSRWHAVTIVAVSLSDSVQWFLPSTRVGLSTAAFNCSRTYVCSCHICAVQCH